MANNTAQQQLDDILDARAKLRQQRIAVDNARITLNQAKIALKETKEHWEDLLTEVEQRQGRLQFDDAEAEQAQAQAPQARRGRPRKERDAEGPRA
jgi:hypothetical protein